MGRATTTTIFQHSSLVRFIIPSDWSRHCPRVFHSLIYFDSSSSFSYARIEVKFKCGQLYSSPPIQKWVEAPWQTCTDRLWLLRASGNVGGIIWNALRWRRATKLQKSFSLPLFPHSFISWSSFFFSFRSPWLRNFSLSLCYWPCA